MKGKNGAISGGVAVCFAVQRSAAYSPIIDMRREILKMDLKPRI
jgi:hypothetical protein